MSSTKAEIEMLENRLGRAMNPWDKMALLAHRALEAQRELVLQMDVLGIAMPERQLNLLEDLEYQKRGIGRALVARNRKLKRRSPQ